jgi:hypothetical protein
LSERRRLAVQQHRAPAHFDAFGECSDLEVIVQTGHLPDDQLDSRFRAELERQQRAEQGSTQGGYVAAYREFKYQEALFDLIARQYEIARVDESREGGQVQVIDIAVAPERKSRPKRSFFAIVGFVLGLAGAATLALARRRAAAV